MPRPNVFVTGGTGYMGRRLISALVTRRHDVVAFVRAGSESRVPSDARAVVGDVLSASSLGKAIPPDSVVVHLVGTPRPSPKKAAQFEALDFASARECIAAAKSAGARHFVYVSVAHPAPVMHAYVDVRVRVEALLRDSGIPHTILRPWYVLGPGHQWPYLLLPMYWILGVLPTTRESARRLGLVTIDQMLSALLAAVESAVASAGTESSVIDVPGIRQSGKRTTA